MLHATGAELLLVDDGYPPADVSTSWQELGRLAGCPSRPVLRIERVAEDASGDVLDAVREAVAEARDRGYGALKTIAAYRGGLDLERWARRIREVALAAARGQRGLRRPAASAGAHRLR